MLELGLARVLLVERLRLRRLLECLKATAVVAVLIGDGDAHGRVGRVTLLGPPRPQQRVRRMSGWPCERFPLGLACECGGLARSSTSTARLWR